MALERVEKWGFEILSVAMLGTGKVSSSQATGGCNVKRNGENKERWNVVRCGVMDVVRGG